jgi:hypothetical protein
MTKTGNQFSQSLIYMLIGSAIIVQATVLDIPALVMNVL